MSTHLFQIGDIVRINEPTLKQWAEIRTRGFHPVEISPYIGYLAAVVPMIGDQYTGPDGERTPQTVDSVNWVYGAIDVNRYPFTDDTVPSPEFTTF